MKDKLISLRNPKYVALARPYPGMSVQEQLQAIDEFAYRHGLTEVETVIEYDLVAADLRIQKIPDIDAVLVANRDVVLYDDVRDEWGVSAFSEFILDLAENRNIPMICVSHMAFEEVEVWSVFARARAKLLRKLDGERV